MSTDREQTVQTAVRVPESLLDRLDKIAERLRHQQPGIAFTRTEVLRLALNRGVELLENEGKKR
jgi:predicted transcriptional regulator